MSTNKIHSPLQITLYDPKTDEVIATYTRTIVPWGLLKKAIKMEALLTGGDGDVTEQDIDSIAGLVCEVFGNQFSIEQVDQGVDISEMETVITGILNRATFGSRGSRDVKRDEVTDSSPLAIERS